MSHHQILVRKITHLTDARYFAAIGVDWLSIRLHSDPATFSFWHTLRDWVAGIRLAAEFDGEDEMVLSKIIIDAKPEGIIADHLDFVHLTGGLEMFVAADEFSPLLRQNGIHIILPYEYGKTDPGSFINIPSDQVFLESDWNEQSISEIKSSGYTGGFCFQSTPESKTGVKDYSEFDRMFEILQE